MPLPLVKAERMDEAGTHAADESVDRYWLSRAVGALGEGWAVVDPTGRLDDVAGELFTILDSPRPHAQAGARLRDALRALRSDKPLRWPPPAAGGWRWTGRRQDGRQVEIQAHGLDGEDGWLLRVRWAEPEPVPAREPTSSAGLYHPATRLPQQPLLIDRLQQAVERSQRTVTHRFAVVLIGLDALRELEGDRAVLRAIARQLEGAVRPADTVAHLDRETLAVIVEPLRGDDATVQIAIDSIVGNLRGALDTIPAEMALGAAASFAVTIGDGGSHPSDLIALARSRLVRRTAPLAAGAGSTRGAGMGRAVTLAVEWALRGRTPLAVVASCADAPDGASLAAACDGLWQTAPDAPPLALVVALEQVPSIEAVQAMKQALERRQPLAALAIDVDEAAVARDPDAAIQLADAMVARGVGFGIARFGKGRCPDALIARLPLSRLSFDPELTADARHAAPARVRLAATIGWAHERGLRVVAAEVAEPAHAALLDSLGCDAARGPLFEGAA